MANEASVVHFTEDEVKVLRFLLDPDVLGGDPFCQFEDVSITKPMDELRSIRRKIGAQTRGVCGDE